MKRITRPIYGNPEKQIFTQGINYFSINNGSIWGRGESETIQAIKDVNPSGIWLDLAAGDGKYATHLVPMVDMLCVADIDIGALSKLYFRCNKNYRNKLLINILNINDSLPYCGNFFDGAICTGTLHLFDRYGFVKIIHEILRVIKPKSQIIFDFAVDFERIFPNGTKFTYLGEHRYTTASATTLISETLVEHSYTIEKSQFSDDLTMLEGYGYISKGSFLLVVVTK